ncbi:MAG TPA: DUF3078 domain-containing protein, partial [Acidobacteriota bacterium]|nr:DUF3078 domain-containing protein [Acidobacteriota bacterium]
MKTYIACNTIVSLLFILGTTTGWAQDVPADTGAVPAWQTDLTGRLSGSQTGFQNWTEGGVNVVSLALGLDGTATHITDGWKQTHQLKVAFGLVKQDTLDFRKAEDIIRISSSFQYAGDGFFRIFNPTIAVSERTQFTEGFNFDKDPLGLGRETPVKVSDFFSPGVFTQSIGLTYQP